MKDEGHRSSTQYGTRTSDSHHPDEWSYPPCAFAAIYKGRIARHSEFKRFDEWRCSGNLQLQYIGATLCAGQQCVELCAVTRAGLLGKE